MRGEELTLEQVGARFGLTRERIRQIQAGALKKLGHEARGQAMLELAELSAERHAESDLASVHGWKQW